MGSVFAEQGALAAAVETTYGVDASPTQALYVVGQPTDTFDHTFEQQQYLRLSAAESAAARRTNKLDLQFQSPVTYMPDSLTDEPDCALVYKAAGFALESTRGTGLGTGNFVEYRPLSAGFAGVTFYRYFKEDGSGNLSYLPYIGTRGNMTIQIQPGSDLIMEFQGSAKHAFYEAFAGGLTPPTDPTDQPHISDSITATVDGVEVLIRSFTYSPNYSFEIEDNPITAGDTGINEIPLTGGTPGGQIVLEFTDALVASSGNNFLRQAVANEVDFPFVITRDDGTQIFRLTMPRMRWQAFTQQDGDTRKQFAIDYVAQNTASGDDHVTIRHEIK